MNKRQVISSLNNIAEELDNNGLYVEAKQVTNIMKKIAQTTTNQTKPNQAQANVSSNLANNLAFSYHSLINIGELIMQIHMETRAKIHTEDLSFNLEPAIDDIRSVYTRMILGTGTDTDTIPFNSTAYYKPKNLIEFRNYISSFYKKEVAKYSNTSWMKKYISDLGSFTNKAVNDLNGAILNKNTYTYDEGSSKPFKEIN
jgi:hypothetical protein